MDTTEGNNIVLNILENIKAKNLKDQDALKFLHDHLDHLSDSTFYRESSSDQVKIRAAKWLKEENIINE